MQFDTIFALYGTCFVGCLSMVVWTHAVLDVIHACVFYFVLVFLFMRV